MDTPRDLLASLASPMRHEANNLLAALTGTAELMLRSRDATARDINRAERLCDAAGRLQALLHAYLALGAPPRDLSPVSVLALTCPLARLCLGPGRVVTAEAAEDLPALPVDALQVAILRLVGEAAVMMAPTAELRLELEPVPGGALLSAIPRPDGPAPGPVFLAAAP